MPGGVVIVFNGNIDPERLKGNGRDRREILAPAEGP